MACQAAPAMSATTFLSDDALQVYGYVGKLADSSGIVVSFRGTDPADIENWIVDLNTTMTTPYPGCSGCGVHSGFYEGYMGLSSQMISAVNEYGGTSAPSIFVTGHSLGAAMAVVATYELVLAGYPVTTSYNFGNPRVGNQAFVDAFAANILTGAPAGLRLNQETTYRDASGATRPVQWSPVLMTAVERALQHPVNAALLAPETIGEVMKGAHEGIVALGEENTPPRGGRAQRHHAIAASMTALREHVIAKIQFPPRSSELAPIATLSSAAAGAGRVPGLFPRALRGVERLGHISKPRPASAITGVAPKAARSRLDTMALAAKTSGGLGDAQIAYYRETHWRDPVPHVPLEAMGFAHSPTEVWWNADSSSFTVCSSSNGEDHTCSDSLDFDLSIADHLNYMGYPISDSC